MEPFQDDVDLIFGGMVIPLKAGSIADQLFGWQPRGWSRGILAHFTFLGVTMSQKSSVIQIANLVP